MYRLDIQKCGVVLFIILITLVSAMFLYYVLSTATHGFSEVDWNATATCINKSYLLNMTGRQAELTYQNASGISSIEGEIKACEKYV